jgi:putative nucleotidyltransferase with HDIG domain
MIPTVDQCLALMEEYDMPENIRAHSLVVEEVASLLARSLREAGQGVALEKVSAGALLHDIAKTECLRTKEDHARKGKKICLDHQLHEIADIVAEHIVLADFDSNHRVLEKEIVYYADKRVKHDEVVSLEERLEYLLDHYGRNEKPLCDLIRKNFNVCKEVERKIFSLLSFHPEDIALLIGRQAETDETSP